MITLLLNNVARGALSRDVPEGQAAPDSRRSRPGDGVTVDLSLSANVMAAVDDIFNLGKRHGGEIRLSRKEQDQVFRIVGELLKNGYVGYEWLRVGNKIERHDVDMKIADSRLRNARLYREPVRHTSFRI